MSTTSDEQEVWSEECTSPTGEYVQINLGRKDHACDLPPSFENQSGTNDAHTFPPALPDWSNVEVLHRNTLPPRTSFHIYDDVEDARTRDVSKSKTLSLSGTWKFNLVKSPFDVPEGFQKPKYDTSKWDDIQVPGMWQLQGYGKGPQYTNTMFPFPVDPGHIPYDANETGCYLRKFNVPERFKNHQIRLRFGGVDSAFHVWINGKEVGYSQGSRNPSEFDVTEFVDLKDENTLAVQNYQFSDASYIEDQDQWWLSGIFRDVELLAFPKVRIEDFQVQTHLDQNYQDATLSIKVTVNTKTPVVVQFSDHSGKPVIQSQALMATPITTFSIPIKNPRKWTAETPYLYQLTLSCGNSCVVEQRVGFRVAELKDGVFVVNGKPIIFRGVNRHEHHPDSGRTVPYEFLRQDLLLMKSHNINAVRTSHYINDPRLYDLADELGLWIMDECDLECHGFGDVGGDPASWASNNPDWETAYVDRARQAVVRDKNHPSIIMWSLGNESFYGRNHQAMYDFIHEYDPTRLIHYEGDRDAQTADIYSQMYTSVDDIIRFATQSETWEKPLVLCEYAHAMGNGPGALKEYIEAFYKYPRLMGGFVWEWANHGLRTKTAEGEEYYGYGGDFGDDPNDYNFVLDGLLTSDHKPTPGLIEYKKAIEPVQVLGGTAGSVEIINRYDLINLDHLRCHWSLVGDGFKTKGKEVKIPNIKPHESATIEISDVKYPSQECYLELSFTLRSSTPWAPSGYEVAFGQIQIQPPTHVHRSLSLTKSAPECKQLSTQILQIAGHENIWEFNIIHGRLISWQKSGAELLETPPVLELYRALTDNDQRDPFGNSWKGSQLRLATNNTKSVTWKIGETSIEIVVEGRYAPAVLQWSVDTTTTYIFEPGQVSIKVKGTPGGERLPNTFARIGLTMGVHSLEKANWFGRGPGESYRDTKLSQRYGNHTLGIKELFTDYEFPQECSNRTDVRWVEFVGKKGAKFKASFPDLEGASFAATHYMTKDLDKSQHPYELYKKKQKEAIVRLDWAHQGIGSGSCGPATLPQYQLRCEPFEYEVLLE